MTIKRWRSDGPKTSSDPMFHTWLAFQGKAFPNPYNGDLAQDERDIDNERERWIRRRDSIEERERRRVAKHMAKRRRERTG